MPLIAPHCGTPRIEICCERQLLRSFGSRLDLLKYQNDQKRIMANIHFIGGEKGGVGKSLVARLLAQYCIDKQLPFLGFDTDRSHGALMRFYAGFASPVLIDRYETLDTIVEAAVEQPERRILVDLAAQTHDPLVRWMDESGVLELSTEAGFSINYWHVMDSGKDSVDLLKRLFDRFENRLNYVLVLNQVRGDDFHILHQSAEWLRSQALGARTVSLRRLHDGVVNKIDAASCSFWAAQNPADKTTTGLGMMDRQRLKTWMRDTYQQLDGIGL
jgi:hypothetical protein